MWDRLANLEHWCLFFVEVEALGRGAVLLWSRQCATSTREGKFIQHPNCNSPKQPVSLLILNYRIVASVVVVAYARAGALDTRIRVLRKETSPRLCEHRGLNKTPEKPAPVAPCASLNKENLCSIQCTQLEICSNRLEISWFPDWETQRAVKCSKYIILLKVNMLKRRLRPLMKLNDGRCFFSPPILSWATFSPTCTWEKTPSTFGDNC